MSTSMPPACLPRRDRLCGALQSPPAGLDATCAAIQSPFERVQPTTASPAPSTASTGVDASCPGVDRRSGCDHPAAERTDAWINRCEPSPHCQTATAPALSSTATVGANVGPSGPEIVAASDQSPVNVLLDVRTACWKS